MFGWCMTGHHRDCPVEIQKFIHVPAKRNKPAHVEMIDEWMECDCSCHGKKQTTKGKRKRK